MRKMLALLLCVFCVASFADPEATHGMQLFGKNTLYANHLSMFNPLHGYQIIMEVEFDDKKVTKELFDNQALDKELYTFRPERFELPVQVAQKKSFMVTVFKGHFEHAGRSEELTFKENGKPLGEVKLNIINVVVNRKFNLNQPERQPRFSTYLLFGKDKEHYVAHYLTGNRASL